MKKILSLIVLAIAALSAAGQSFSETIYTIDTINNDTVWGETLFFNVISPNEAELTSSPNGYGGNFVVPASILHDETTYLITAIGNNAFMSCQYLYSVTLSDTLEMIGDMAFGDCPNLTAVALPVSLQSIGDYAFNDCGVVSLDIPAALTHIGSFAFLDCTALEAVNVSSSNQNYSSDGGVLYDKLKDTLLYYPVAKVAETYAMPDNVVTIIQNAFKGNTYLKNLTLSSNLASIGDYAFNGCNKLLSVNIPMGVQRIGTEAFKDCTKLTAVNVDENNQYYAASGGVLHNKGKDSLIYCPCGKVGNYAISDSVERILDYAFYNCSSLTGITIPNSVNDIGEYAFSGCGKITAVSIPSSVTIIKERTFMDCIRLQSVSLNEGLTELGSYAFANCAVSSISFPSTMEEIGNFAFSSCETLESIISSAAAPPVLYQFTFNMIADNAKIYVPCQYEANYMAADFWRDLTFGDCIGNSLSDIEQKISINVYPNPTKDVLNVESASNITTIELFNILGQRVFVSKPNNKVAIINVSDFKQGNYILKSYTENGISTKKVVFQ
ncbi:MAG: leucine-rich repeat protein [Bacteroidales bacterium]|jgi:hypothetical protein|nr:leucine-rich repeat protein [Bacteroidales bacterium]